MARNKNITMKQFNGTDYDTLYPKTKVEQVEGAYTQQQILADSTKTLFGMGNYAVPDNVLAYLGKYNQHWWKRRVWVDNGAYGEWNYVQSSERNAYPDSGVSNGYEYKYLGIPFDNAVTVPKIATGSYTGTGTCGESNPNSLTFDFVPKLVFIFAESSDGYTGIFFDSDVSHCYQLTPTITSGDRLWLYKSGKYSITFDKNFSWYYDYTNGMEQQFNTSGTTYDYIAIG